MFIRGFQVTQKISSSFILKTQQAGKGRTGLMVSSYLVYTGLLAEEALQVYADKRTTNNLGVSSPFL